MKIVSIFLTLSLLLVACTAIQPETSPGLPMTPPDAESAPATTPETNAPETGGEVSLLGTQWVLESFGTVGTETPVVGEVPITLEFVDEAQVSGNGGCNSYGGSYQVEGNRLMMGEIVSTLVACVDSDLMEQETQYMEALQTVSEFQLDGDHLSIMYNEGLSALNYVSANANSGGEKTPATDTPEPEVAVPNTSTLEIDTSASAATGESQNFVWNCFSCLTPAWSFEDGEELVAGHLVGWDVPGNSV